MIGIHYSVNSKKDLSKVVDGIYNGFIWDEQKQGHEFWHTAWEHLLSLGAANAKGNLIGGGNIRTEIVKEAYVCLLTSLDWEESPQGKKYWCMVYEALGDILGDYGVAFAWQEDPADAYDRAMKGI